ncbi:HNH endonuclease signature motif containing protein [Nocardioides sp. 616]|uniref:HNH endonuclease signature motif containing protein n=1 Tax=Nocardioides sp. 616 TaxID=2268090 RepID=UPI000CE57188|nr:HNH endonuclease signature motif containing protein [Nocardioides sp. 616]
MTALQETETSTETSAEMIDRVRRLREVSCRAEMETFVLAAEWADAHPDQGTGTPGPCAAGCESDDPSRGDYGGGCAGPCPEDPHGLGSGLIPGWSWSAAAPLGAALGRTTLAADLLIRDALIVRHRMPMLWQRVLSCQVEAWRARRIAKALVGRPRDVSDWLDANLAPVAHRIGVTVLDRLIDEAMLRLHPEEREQEQLDALDARYARLHEGSINDSAIAEMSLRADWKDLHDFDRTLSDVAAALATLDAAAGRPADSLDVRRARAVGVVADPAQALALLHGARAPKPRKQVRLVLHLTPDHVAGRDPVGRNGTLGRAELEQTIREWCGRSDSHLRVLPVIDLADHTETDRYEIPLRTKDRVDLLTGTCVFPWCTRPSRHCDHDHVVPHGAGGPTCDCNLAPLCRRHHRLKTHAGWRYTTLDTGTWLWSDPYGQQFLRDHAGTLDVTPRPSSAGPEPARSGRSALAQSTRCRR